MSSQTKRLRCKYPPRIAGRAPQQPLPAPRRGRCELERIVTGLRPYAQIGFMPQALSIRPGPYQHQWRPGLPYDEIYTGWSYPPKDYAKWAELVHQWVKHCVEKYGPAEVAQWY